MRFMSEIDHQTAIGGGSPGDAMTSAAHGDLEAGGATEIDGGNHIGGSSGSGDERRVLVDHAVVEPPCLVVAGVARSKEIAAERGFDLVETGDLRTLCC